ncbi:MAG TPA: beta-propeller fold lactonase family protein, partial [Polyangiaceae bacterium]
MRKVLLSSLMLAASAGPIAGCVTDNGQGSPDLDAGVFDVSVPGIDVNVPSGQDAGAPPAQDTGAPPAPDATVPDAGEDSAGGEDAGPPVEASTPDAGGEDANDSAAPLDAGVDADVDAGVDAAVDAGPTYTHFVYYTGSSELEAFGVDETSGALVPIAEGAGGGGSVIVPTGGNSLAAVIQGSTLYTANTAVASVGAYTISHGRLTQIDAQLDAGLDYPAGQGVRFVVASSKFVFTANETGNSISRYAIGSGGTLTPLGDVGLPTGALPKAIAVDPTGKFLFSFNYGLTTIAVYVIDASGGLTPVDQSATAPGQQDFSIPTGAFMGIVHPTLRTVYVSGYSTSN